MIHVFDFFSKLTYIELHILLVLFLGVNKEIIDAESDQNDQAENQKIMIYRNSKRNRQRRHTGIN